MTWSLVLNNTTSHPRRK